MKNNKSPIKWLGSKRRMASYLVKLIPPHSIYVEPFFGGGSVFFRKNPSKIEIINDTNDLLVNFFKVIRTRLDEFKKRLNLSLHSRLIYNSFRETNWESLEPVEKAFRFYYLVRNAWSGLYRVNERGEFNAPFAGGCNAVTKEGMRNLAKQYFKMDEIMAASKRLKNATIECLDYKQILHKYDSQFTFYFFDPPYDTDYQYSGEEMFDHHEFKRIISKLNGQWILTLNQELKDEFAGFDIEEFDLAVRMNKNSRSEYVRDIVVKSMNLKQGRHGFSKLTDFLR